MNFADAETLKDLLALLAPGFIILMVLEAHKVGPRDSLQQRFFNYAVASTAYFATLAPLIRWIGGSLNADPFWIQLVEYGAVPILLGALLAVMRSARWFDGLSRALKLAPIHHIPSAWDWAFTQQRDGVFIIATLENGNRFAGPWQAPVFASSDMKERDLYIPEVWDAKETGPWELFEPRRGILLCGNDIKTIEFFYPGDQNEETTQSTTSNSSEKGSHRAAET